jgi:hypothetical protein
MTPFRPKGVINPSLNISFWGGPKRVDGLNDGHLQKDFHRGILIIEMLLAFLQPKEVEDEAAKNVKRLFCSQHLLQLHEGCLPLVFIIHGNCCNRRKRKGGCNALPEIFFTALVRRGAKGLWTSVFQFVLIFFSFKRLYI